MTIRSIPVLGAALRFDTTGQCFPEPASVLGSNDRWPYNVIRFGLSNAAEPTVRHGFYGNFVIPDDYVGAPALIVPAWTATLTAGNVVWDFDYRAVGGDDAESLDQSGETETLTVTDAAPTAAHRLLIPTGLALTAGGLAAGDLIQFGFFRDGADGADTLAGAAILHGLNFVYSDA